MTDDRELHAPYEALAYARQMVREELKWAREALGLDRSGFEDLPPDTRCRSDEHRPPNMICVPEGKRYRHICPACGAVSYIYPRGVRL